MSDASSAAQERYLESLRRRVAWQATAAEAERADGPVSVPAPPEPEPEPQPRPVAVPAGPTVVPATAELEFELGELERRVRAAAATFPERVEEWRYTLFYLRDFATPEGRLPADFGALVHEAFRELL